MPIWNQKGVYLGNRATAVVGFVTSGLVLNLDAGNSASYPVTKNFVSAKIYSTYNGGLRSSNYTVQYSDDNSTWTTAFSGVATNNTSCGIQQNTGVGNGSYGARRYWRYVEGSAVASHHPRVSRIILTDINGNDYPLITYTTDNCADTGTYIVGTVSVDLSTIWFDLNGSGNDLTLSNSPTFTSGLGGYFTFNGSTQFARRSIFYSSATNWSMAAFIRPANLNQLSMYMQNGRDDGVNAPFNGYGIGLGNGSSTGSAATGAKLQVIHGGVTYVNPEYTFTSTSSWYYVVATRDTTTSRYYVNGTQTSLTSTSAPNAPTDVFSVGAGTSSTAAVRYFAGDVSIVQFYNKQLSQAEITQNFNAFRVRYGI